MSEDLVIYRAGDGLHLVFRFPRAEAGRVARLAQDLRRRLGVEAPALPPGMGDHFSVRSTPERATEIWTPPSSVQQ